MLIGLENYATIKPYARIQNLAKDTVFDLLDFIKPGVTEKEIASKAKSLLEQKGITRFWYYDVAALVLVGDRTTLSIPGRDYVPADFRVQTNDLVTVDLSPLDGDLWGDYARSIYVEDGVAKLTPTKKTLSAGFNLETLLHNHLLGIARPDMTAHELWAYMNAMIEKHGFENLDFKGNLGHSIEKDMKYRRYIEKDNMTRLQDFGLFTFEPHIRQKGQVWGFKHENIHFFSGTKLQAL
ncbi:MAG: M24 family metallopeptidase [Alphaproteobacteria bacterium]|nr:M24 family metallopeptidase [Alphaproteobacteria bacterium]